MKTGHLLTAATAAALIAGSSFAQTPAAQPPTATTEAPATPPASGQAPAGTPATPGSSQVVASGDIVQTAQASGQFKTFLKAAEATNLTNLLKTQQNITVFAPTDAAFAALPAGELDKLMLPENKAELQKLLIYHLVNAPVKSDAFKGSTRTAATVAGPSVELQGGETLMVNDATIVQADIAASNGVLHVVNKVLSPTTAPSTDTAAAAASATTPATTEPPATPKAN